MRLGVVSLRPVLSVQCVSGVAALCTVTLWHKSDFSCVPLSQHLLDLMPCLLHHC